MKMRLAFVLIITTLAGVSPALTATSCHECTGGLTPGGVCKSGGTTGPCPGDHPMFVKMRSAKDCPNERLLMVCDHKSLSNIRCSWKCKAEEKAK
jgi:hypothetical protein